MRGLIYFVFLFPFFAFSYLYSSWKFGSSTITIKALGLGSYLEDTAYKLEQTSQDARNRIYQIKFSKWTIVNSITAFFLCLFSFLAFRAVLKQQLSPSGCASIIMIFYSPWVMLEGISIIQDDIYNYVNALKRFIDLCCTKVVDQSPSTITTLSNSWSAIKVDNLSFTYTGKNSPALKDVSLTIPRGEIIAHILSTVRLANQILVFNQGQIVDQGSFNELIDREGLFSEMWGIQGLVSRN